MTKKGEGKTSKGREKSAPEQQQGKYEENNRKAKSKKAAEATFSQTVITNVISSYRLIAHRNAC
ncbi:hypothetical protein BOO93_16110 [Vibrio navarrensis]|nr:hypothetical protein [Vibrio navarrensis]